MGKGLLTGKIDADTKFNSTDFRNTVPRFSAENRKANQALVDLLSRFAEQGKATAQVALAGLLANKPGIVPMFRSRAQRSCIALKKTSERRTLSLRPEDLRALESASSKIKVVGARYPEFHEQLTGR